MVFDPKTALELGAGVKTAWDLTKSAGEISEKVYNLIDQIGDRGQKKQLDQILDEVRNLKRAAAALEDENRQLREKARFKSDDYEFRYPFRYHKAHPDQPLCLKCWVKGIEGHMSPPATPNTGKSWRRCLICDDTQFYDS